MRKLIFITLLITSSQCIIAQNDPEFPKEFIMHLRLHNGMVTNFHQFSPDQYVGGIQLIPQFTLVEHKLRGGIIAGAFYTGKKFQGEFGPTVSLKLKTLDLKQLTSGGNLHLAVDYLFGTEQERLIGGGIYLDLGNWIVLGMSVHRDYNLNTWWFQNTMAVRISKVKKITSRFARHN